MTEQTLAIIKPDGVERSLTIECIERIEREGLEIKEKKMMIMSREMAEKFREDIKQKHPGIFEALIEYMTEGPIIAMIIEGKNATDKLRKVCGATNPKEAEKGTIRGDFGNKDEDMKELYKKGKVVRNIIHSSGNQEEAKKEMELLFGGLR